MDSQHTVDLKISNEDENLFTEENMEQSDHIKKEQYRENDVITVYDESEEGEIMDMDSVNERRMMCKK